MAGFSRSLVLFATMLVAAALFLLRDESGIAHAQSAPTSCSTSTSTSTSSSTSTPRAALDDRNYDRPLVAPSGPAAPAGAAALPPCPPGPTGADSSSNSITDVANQRFNQMITNRVLGTVLLG